MAVYTIPIVTTAERLGYTPISGEHIYDEDLEEVFFGDGSTVGGLSLIGATGPQGPPGTLTEVKDDTSPQLGGFLDPNGNYVGSDQGVDLSSASPLIIGTDGDYFDVTGALSFADMTVAANRFFILQFDAILTITNGAPIVIPGGVNFTTSPGDQLLCFSIAPNTVRIVGFAKADGTPIAIDISKDLSPQLGGFLDPDGNYIGSDKGGNLASSSPLIIGIDGDYFNVTGTTDFDSMTVAANRDFQLEFDGVLTITNGASIVIPGGGNFITSPGDIINCKSTATDVVRIIGIAVDTSPRLNGPLNGQDFEVSKVNLKDYGEITNIIGSIGGGTQDIDLELGNNVTATVDTSTTTFTFSNPTVSGSVAGLTLLLTNGGSQTVNWPVSVKWPGGVVPILTTSGVDILVFLTFDGGTTWYGTIAITDAQ